MSSQKKNLKLSTSKFKNILKCVKELDEISQTNNTKRRKKLIKEAKNCVIDSISEIAKNCLTGNVPLKNCDFKKLSKYKKVLRKLSQKSPNSRRRKLLQQTGGTLLPSLIIPALTFVASIIGDAIRKKL